MSPGTSSRLGMLVRVSSRTTKALGAASLRSAARAASARRSCTTPMMAFSSTMAMMAAASAQSPSRALTTLATIKIITTKLANCWATSFQKGGRGASRSSLAPTCTSRRSASAWVRPWPSRVASWSSTTSTGSLCQAASGMAV